MEEKKSGTRSEKQESSKKRKPGRPRKSKGLGDTVEKVTKATGIKKAVDWFSEKTGADCGCDKRKEKLNKLFPYKPKGVVQCLQQQEYEFLKDKIDATSWTGQEKNRMTEIHARVFNKRLKYTGCAQCIRDKAKELRAVMRAYEEENV